MLFPRLLNLKENRAGASLTPQKKRWAFQPTVDLLEDRCLLSTLYVAPRGSDEFAAAAPAAVLSAHRYEGFAHEIFNDPEQARVLGDLTAWLDARWPRR